MIGSRPGHGGGKGSGGGNGGGGTAQITRLQNQLAQISWTYYEDLLDLNVPQSQVVVERADVERLRAQILNLYGISTEPTRGGPPAPRKVTVPAAPVEAPPSLSSRRKRSRPVDSDPATDPNSCAKTRLGHVAQLLLGRTVKRGDVHYEVQEHGAGEHAGFSAAVHIPEYDPTLHAGQMCTTTKEAEVSAAEVMLKALEPVWMPLEQERKAKRQAKIMEEQLQGQHTPLI